MVTAVYKYLAAKKEIVLQGSDLSTWQEVKIEEKIEWEGMSQ